jgi:PadR family transcriptional regulator, regulatory protein PadR
MPTDGTAPALPRNFLRPCLLLLLREQPAHGYELLERVGAFGYDRSDPGGLYRTLRALEDYGLVHSVWEKSEAGPDRRIYELTKAGGEELHRHAKALASGADVLETFVSRYAEFVELRRPARRRAGAASR